MVANRRWCAALDLSVGAGTAATAMALAGLMGAVLFHAFFGDPAVYLPYAKNIGHGDLFSYNPNEFSSGSTSPLWALVLALPYAVSGGVTGAKVLAVVVSCIAVMATGFAARRIAGSWAVGGALSMIVIGTSAFFAAMLYESGLVVIMSALSIVAAARFHAIGPGKSRGDVVRAAGPLALVWAALPLCRPDAVVLVVLEAVALALFVGGIRRRRLLAIAAALGFATLPGFAYYGYSEVTLGVYSVSGVARAFALGENRTLLARAGPLNYSRPAYDYIVANLTLVTAAAIGFVAEIVRRRLVWLGAYGLSSLAAYGLLLLVVQPVTSDADRYFVPVVPVVAVGIAAVVGIGVDALQTGRVVPITLTLVALAAVQLAKLSAGTRGLAVDLVVFAAAGILTLSRRPWARFAGVVLVDAVVAFRYARHSTPPPLGVPGWYAAAAAAVLLVTVVACAVRFPLSRAAAVAALGGIFVVVGGSMAASGDAAWQRARSVSRLPYPLATIVEADLAQRVNRIAPPDASVLLYEVQDRYFLRPDIDVLSLDGITDGKVIPYLRDHDLVTFLRRYQPGYWAANAAVEERPFLRESALRPVYERLLQGAHKTTSGGIVFTVVARNPSPAPPGLAAWRLLVGLRYTN